MKSKNHNYTFQPPTGGNSVKDVAKSAIESFSLYKRVPQEHPISKKKLSIFTTGTGKTFRIHIKPEWSAVDR